MMDRNPVIVDISSDEESSAVAAAFDDPIGDDYSWLSRLLCDEVDDSDEVVVVREVKSKSCRPTAAIAADDDDDKDDCVVLDGDPDKSVEDVDDQANDEDELQVVGQKGEIACRDLPHLRHHCAKFPFTSTAHELCCDQCYCYVCDTKAPCAHWGTGVCNNDHCHATDKEAFWKSQRESFRRQKDAPLPVQKVPNPALSSALSHLNQTPPLDIIRLTSNPITQTQVCRPAVVRPCSSSTRLGIPNIISQGRSRQPGLVHNKSGYQTHPVSQQPQFLRVRDNVIWRDRAHNTSNIGMFKRTGIAGGALATNRPVHGLPNQGRGPHLMQSTRNPARQTTSNNVFQMGCLAPSMNNDSCTYQKASETCTASVFASTVPSQPQVYNQPISNPQAYNQLLAQQLYSQPIPEPQVYSQPNPESQVYSQPITGPQLCSQPFPPQLVPNQAISQPHVQSQAIPQPHDSQNASQFCSQGQGSDLSDLDEWVNIDQSNQQQPVEDFQLSSTGSTNESLPVKEFNSQGNGSDEFHCNELEFPNWFPENDSVDMVSEGCFPSNLNILSPEQANFDAGMLLFDFETSLNGLAQV